MKNHRLVNQIEMVQRRAARWVTGRHNNNTSSVSDMLQSLYMQIVVHANCVGRLYRSLVLYDILITNLLPRFGSLFRNYYVFFR